MINEVPVVFAFDDNYFMPFMVSAESLLYTKNPQTNYSIFCLVPNVNNVQKSEADKLQKKYLNCKITFIDMGQEFCDSVTDTIHISFVSYYRFKIPEVLKDYGKAIYLDVDTIVKEDLSELFSRNIGDNLIGAVKHSGMSEWKSVKNHPINVGEFFNSGVMLMNLSQIRREGKADLWMSMTPKNLDNRSIPLNDQDILNATCSNRVDFLPLRYNFMIKLLRPNFVIGAAKFYKEDFVRSKNNPAIIHYADSEKPWSYHGMWYQQEWDNFYMMSSVSNGHPPQGRRSYFLKRAQKIIFLWIKKKIIRIKRKMIGLIKSIPVVGSTLTYAKRKIFK